MTPQRSPSSADAGTFMKVPELKNQYFDDTSLNRVLSLFLPIESRHVIAKDLERFGDEVMSPKVMDWVTDAERNVPYLKGSGRDAFGQRTDELVTSQGWKNLQRMGLKEGIVAIAHENEFAEYSRMVQFAKYHIWTGSSAIVTCPSAMQDGAASLLKRHLQSGSLDAATHALFSAVYGRLTARHEDAWTSGQWMTERVGGSDVSGTETVATRSPTTTGNSHSDSWLLNGFKWFSSATDAQMSIATAQAPGGLSAFYVPMRIATSSTAKSALNGIQISRLKNKMGTKALPTAELVLKDTRAVLVGKEGEGIRELSTVLNITRIHNAVSAIGLLGRGLAIAKAFALARELPGKGVTRRLGDIPLHVKALADVTIQYRADMLFTFWGVYLLGLSDQPSPCQNTRSSIASESLRPESDTDLQLLLRLLTPPLKALTAKDAISGLQECMEALGGVGYLENSESESMNVARLYRDANVLGIWEGTTNVLGADFVRILKGKTGKQNLEALERWVAHALTTNNTTLFSKEKDSVMKALETFKSMASSIPAEALTMKARQMMRDFSVIVAGTLLIVDAEQNPESINAVYLRRFLAMGGELTGNHSWAIGVGDNYEIVFGEKKGTGISHL
ncbi:very-long-chain acyl-CoA dehydrogenase [Calycina marina]|uniref:Very-long-chain acyl-CoA dehydrogenase n=1 Tax=Calycina marina TaxID=1763456 RepID=A0A9P7YYF5_9HELO|nr:very-long-chain acyl-CoA dehydrogenase [Calycina marina]